MSDKNDMKSQFRDKQGQKIFTDTNLANVNIDVLTDAEYYNQRWLAEWDETKPNLGTMDQLLPSWRAVPDPAMQVVEPQIPQPVSSETWLQRLDRTKPNLGTMRLPVYTGPELPEPQEP